MTKSTTRFLIEDALTDTLQRAKPLARAQRLHQAISWPHLADSLRATLALRSRVCSQARARGRACPFGDLDLRTTAYTRTSCIPLILPCIRPHEICARRKAALFSALPCQDRCCPPLSNQLNGSEPQSAVLCSTFSVDAAPAAILM